MRQVLFGKECFKKKKLSTKGKKKGNGHTYQNDFPEDTGLYLTAILLIESCIQCRFGREMS